MFKKFKDFLLRLFFQDNDYIVGYSGETGEEIRVKWNDIKQSLTGEPGKSVQIQFSANNSDWHYPTIDNDKFIKFKLGIDDWSPSYKIVGEGGGSSEPGNDGREVEMRSDGAHIQWKYVGESNESWRNIVELSSLKGAQGNAATIQIGDVYTAEPGTAASVDNVGTPTNAILDFTIPAGRNGTTKAFVQNVYTAHIPEISNEYRKVVLYIQVSNFLYIDISPDWDNLQDVRFVIVANGEMANCKIYVNIIGSDDASVEIGTISPNQTLIFDMIPYAKLEEGIKTQKFILHNID